MSRKDVMGNIKLNRFDELFGAGTTEDVYEGDSEIKEISLSELHEFKNHPFKIRPDAELKEMIESVRQHGVLVPGIARIRPEGGYEIIAGHTRRHICEMVGLKTMPMFVREMNDDEACVIMVDSNIQRENIFPSEKAKAYKMKYEAMKNQGMPGNSLKSIGEENGENYKAVQRYIWLARLNPGLLQMLDDKQLGLVQGVSISALNEEDQKTVHKVLWKTKVKLSVTQAATVKQLGMDGKLTEETLADYLQSAGKGSAPKKLTISRDRLESYFAPEYSEQEMTEVIFRLLEEWKEREAGKGDEERRVQL